MTQLVANILVAASFNLLLALSLHPGYHTTRFFNLAHAFLPTSAAYLMWFFASTLIMPPLLAGLFGIIAASVTAITMEMGLFAPLRRRGLADWQLLAASLGAYTVLVNTISVCFGDDIRTLGLTPAVTEIFGANISNVRLLIIASAAIGFGLSVILLKYTPLGRAIRAVGSNVELAEIVGVSPGRTAILAIGLGGLYAGMAGVLTGVDSDLNPGMGFRLLINGLVTLIIAGLGNISGLVGAALLLAFGQHLVAYFFDSKWMEAVAFLILIGFLIWKPLGFSGRRLKQVEV